MNWRFRRHGVRKPGRAGRLLAATIMVAALVATLAATLAASHRDARSEIDRRFAGRADVMAGSIDGLLAAISGQRAGELADRYGGTAVRVRDLARYTRATEALYTTIVERDGRVAAATRGAPVRARERAGRIAALLQTQPDRGYAVTGVVRESGRAVIEYAVPFTSGRRWRLLVNGVPIRVWSQFLDATLARTLPTKAARAVIVDSGGRLVGDSAGALGAGSADGRHMLDGVSDALIVRSRIGSTPLELLLAVPRESLYKPVSGGRTWLPWLLLALASLAMVTGLVLMVRLAASHVALTRSEERYSLAVQGANDGIWDWDLDTATIHFSDRWAQILGTTPAVLGDHPTSWLDRVHPDDRDGLAAAIEAHLAGGCAEPLAHEHRLRSDDGGWVWVLVRGLALFDARGRAHRMAGSLTDVTERRRAVERLVHQASHDPLTGLANRGHFHRLLDRELERAGRDDGPPCALVFLDLDDFKAINDRHGHLVGDSLLREVGRRLEESVRPGDVAGRLGGDEFAVLMPGIRDEADAAAAAERLLVALAQPMLLGDGLVRVSASVGVAVAGPGHAAEDLLRDADAAMYRDKLRA